MRVLTDHRHRVFIRQVKFLLNQKRTKGDPAAHRDITVLTAFEILRILLINQIPGQELTQLHPAIVRKDAGTGKANWGVVESDLFASSSIHVYSKCKGFAQKPAFFLHSLYSIISANSLLSRLYRLGSNLYLIKRKERLLK